MTNRGEDDQREASDEEACCKDAVDREVEDAHEQEADADPQCKAR